MTKCPVCRVNAWETGKYGYLRCPNCRTPFLVGKTGIKLDTRNNIKYLAGTGRNKPRDSDPVKGEVICAACGLPFPESETYSLGSAIDGKVETDGKTFVERQTGWTLLPDNSTFVPHYERRAIPKIIRGWFCGDCASYLPIRRVGDDDLKISRNMANRGRDIANNGLPKHLGPFTTISPLG